MHFSRIFCVLLAFSLAVIGSCNKEKEAAHGQGSWLKFLLFILLIVLLIVGGILIGCVIKRQCCTKRYVRDMTAIYTRDDKQSRDLGRDYTHQSSVSVFPPDRY